MPTAIVLAVAVAVTVESAVDVAVSVAVSVSPSLAPAGTVTFRQMSVVAPGVTFGVVGCGVEHVGSSTSAGYVLAADSA